VQNIAELDDNAAFSHEKAARLLALQQRLQRSQASAQLSARQLARPGRTERLHPHAQQQVEAGPVYRFRSCTKVVVKTVQIYKKKGGGGDVLQIQGLCLIQIQT
jgi:hypothetical protein